MAHFLHSQGDVQALQILIVEDNYLIAYGISDILSNARMEAIGPIGSLDTALEMLKTPTFDAALIDLDLHGIKAFPLGLMLQERSIPFAFISGYLRSIVPYGFYDVPFLDKPFGERELLPVVRELCASRGF